MTILLFVCASLFGAATLMLLTAAFSEDFRDGLACYGGNKWYGIFIATIVITGIVTSLMGQFTFTLGATIFAAYLKRNEIFA